MPKQKGKPVEVSRAEITWAAKILGAQGGRIGGRRRMETQPYERIVEISRMAALARWSKRKAKESAS
jgi:hypothetical protein